MAEKESFFSRFFGNKKKEGCCCQLNIVKNEEKTESVPKKSDEAKEVGGEKDKNKNSAKTISDPLALFSKSFSKGSGIVAVGR